MGALARVAGPSIARVLPELGALLRRPLLTLERRTATACSSFDAASPS